MKSPRTALERYLPLVYMLTAMVLIIALLPTALRPPQAPPPTSSEFSPDAPPNEDQEILLTELSQGKSRTAGSAGTFGGVVEEELEAVAPRRQLPRRGRCFGSPPRQTDSSYSPPCAPAFVGSNGGATWKGVTGSEIRLAMLGDSQEVGPVPVREEANESDATRTRRVFQQYFNERFELYGRQLRLYVVSSDSEASGSSPAAVQKADEEFKVFGFISSGAGTVNEALRRKLVNYGSGSSSSTDLSVDNAPYMWSWIPMADTMFDLTGELMCKQLQGKPVQYTSDAGAQKIKGTERVFGQMQYNDSTHHNNDKYMAEKFARCGGKFKVSILLNIGDQSGEVSTAMAKMQSAGVTTILGFQEYITLGATTRAATSQNYWPEWIGGGGLGTDINVNVKRAMDPNQWKYALTITWREMPAPTWQRDHYRAYKDVDPDREPSGGSFYELMQFVGGFQQAGALLTPDSFQSGMFKRWPRQPAQHIWATAGGYAQNDWAFADYVPLVYWDPLADDWDSDLPGAYRYLYGGKRFTHGEIPSDTRWHCYSNADPVDDTSGCGTVTWASRDGETKSW